MAKKIYLNGGTYVSQQKSSDIDREALKEAEKKSVYILNLSSNDEERRNKEMVIFDSYFKELGANEVNFISATAPDEVSDIINQTGILYLPGGDTELLLKNLREKNLVELIRNFKGIIIGNSAGTQLLCKKATIFPSKFVNEFFVLDGLGLVDFFVDVHYNETHDDKLLELSDKEDIYAITENNVIIVDSQGSKKYMGEVYLFSKGNKSKIN